MRVTVAAADSVTDIGNSGDEKKTLFASQK
jgi:hypothetical protein